MSNQVEQHNLEASSFRLRRRSGAKTRVFVVALVVALFQAQALQMSAYAPGDRKIDRLVSPVDLSQSVRVGSTAGSDFEPGKVLVKYRSQTSQQARLLAARSIARLEQGLSMRLSSVNRSTDVRSYRIPEGQDVRETVEILRKDPAVEYAEPNYLFSIAGRPNDQLYGDFVSSGTTYSNSLQRWIFNGAAGDRNLNAEAAWDLSTGRSDVIIAIIDTGVMIDHRELEPNIWKNANEKPDNGIDDDNNGFIDDVNGWDFRGKTVTAASLPDDDPNPDIGDGIDDDNEGGADDVATHGTLVASIAGARGNDNRGIAGVCWNCKLMPLKVFADDGKSRADDVGAAITYAANNGASVINLSITSTTRSQAHEDAINYALSKGAVVIAAAGNENTAEPRFPASIPGVLAVGSTHWGGDFPIRFGTVDVVGNLQGRAPFSNFGPDAVDVVTAGMLPGISFITKAQELAGNGRAGDAQFIITAGTSFAAPVVAGVAALMFSYAKDLNVGLTNDRVAQIIENTAVDLPDDPQDVPDGGANWDNHGRANLLQALLAVKDGLGGPGNNPPVIGRMQASLNGNALNVSASAKDADGDITSARISILDGAGRLLSELPQIEPGFGNSTLKDFTLNGIDLSGLPAGTNVSLVLVDSLGHRSIAATADFTQGDADGPTLSKVSASGKKLKVTGKKMAGFLEVEINGVKVLSFANSKSGKLKLKGSAEAFNLRTGFNRMRIFVDSRKSNALVFER